jgi:hypothetical protein
MNMKGLRFGFGNEVEVRNRYKMWHYLLDPGASVETGPRDLSFFHPSLLFLYKVPPLAVTE